jgi:hypothetical protein
METRNPVTQRAQAAHVTQKNPVIRDGRRWASRVRFGGARTSFKVFFGMFLAMFLAMFVAASAAFGKRAPQRVFWARFEHRGLLQGAQIRFRRAVKRAVRKAGMVAVGKGRIKPRCRARTCLVKKGRARRARWNLELWVKAIGESYIVRALFYETAHPKRVTKRRATCEICTLDEACAKVRDTVHAVLQSGLHRAKTPRPWAGRERTRRTNPDEVKARKAKMRETKAHKAKAHKAKAHGATASRPFEAANPLLQRARPVRSSGLLEVQQSAQRQRQRQRRAKTLRSAGWILAGASLLGWVPGAVLLGIDGKGTCAKKGECPRLYDTRTGGIVALSLGGACLAAAVTLYVWGALEAGRGSEKGGAGGGATAGFTAQGQSETVGHTQRQSNKPRRVSDLRFMLMWARAGVAAAFTGRF